MVTRRAESTSARVRGLLSDVLELAQVRLELAGIEAREDLSQVLVLVFQGAVAVVLLGLGLMFLGLWLTVLVWETHPLLALGGLTAVFLGGSGLLAWLAWRRARGGLRLFRSSREELQRDREQLGS